MPQGNQEQLTALYREYGSVIYWRCVRLLGEPAAAEDATQETFIRVHRHLAKAPDSDEALGWIWRIATNYCLNQLRNQKRARARSVELPPPIVDSQSDLFADRELALQVIMRAPPKTRSVACLHYVDGLGKGEIARILGVSARTVTNRLNTFLTNARKYVARAAS